MRARVVSAPTPSAVTYSTPPWTIVPAYTRAPSLLSSGIGSPVIVLSSTAALPRSTSPSTGILCPGLITTVSPRSTSPGATSTCPLPRSTRAVCGTRSMRLRSSRRVRSRVLASSHPPRTKRKVTAAASQCSPMTSAPAVAMVTSTSMPICLRASERAPRTAMSEPARTAAETIRTSCAASSPNRCRRARPARMRAPSTATSAPLLRRNRAISESWFFMFVSFASRRQTADTRAS